MKTTAKILGAIVVLIVAFGIGWLTAATGRGLEADVASLEARELGFVERMQNVALRGHFTVEGREPRDGLEELYEIAEVTKLDGNRWRFDVRVKYMSVDVTLPVVVPIEWAGDTPMVSITDVALPGLGEGFSARVLFYDERYAGTWDHGEYGGLMYGTIAPRGEDAPAIEPTQVEPSTPALTESSGD